MNTLLLQIALSLLNCIAIPHALFLNRGG